MVGLLDILSGLMNGQQQPQGMLSQQPQSQGQLPANFLQNISRALIAQGQPSMYKQSTGMGLLNGLNAGLSGDASPYQMQAMMNSPDKQGLEKMVAIAQLKKASDPSWKETKDAFGNPLVYNSDNPTQTMPLGNGSGNPFAPISPGAPTPAGAAQAGQQQISGDDFLKTLQPNIASQVKALADGKMQFPGGFALKSPYWQQMISAVSQYDPNFDAVNYNARSKTRNSFVAGPDANNITALNTGMNHAASLKDAYDQLGNTDYPSINTAKNWLGNTFGDTTTQTNTAAVSAKGHALSGELAKVFRSTGMAESDIKSWEDKLSTSATPAQSKEILNSAMDLMEGRLQALSSKYNQGMGTTKNGIDLLSPEAQKAYYKVRGQQPYSVNASGNPNQAIPSASGNAQGNVISYQDYFK